MRINKQNAMQLWEERYGSQAFANDFHGNLMYKYAFGNRDYCINYRGQTIYCGWNLHHILPVAASGTNQKQNLLCTNIATNDAAADKTTFWIDDCLYQVQRMTNGNGYRICKK